MQNKILIFCYKKRIINKDSAILCWDFVFYIGEIQDFIGTFSAAFSMGYNDWAAFLDFVFDVLKDVFLGFGIQSR